MGEEAVCVSCMDLEKGFVRAVKELLQILRKYDMDG